MALQEQNLGQDMRKEIVILDMQRIRQCVHCILDSVVTSGSCYGGIFLDNVIYMSDRPVNEPEDHLRLAFTLGGPKDVSQLWNQWIRERSSNIAYIPPEEILATGDNSKVNSWAVGCLLIQLLNYGKPLRLRRHWRYDSAIEHFDVEEPQLLDRLKAFYSGIGQEPGLAVGPEIAAVLSQAKTDTDNAVKIPYACEDFLAHCLDPVPVQRWTVDQLRKHPFVDLRLSLEQLFATDPKYYQTLPLIKHFALNNVWSHPYLANSTTYTIVVGDSTDVDSNRPNTPVEVWKFALLNEVLDRDLYTRAYGKLLDLLTLENSSDESKKQRAGFFRIRALQQGNQNIVRHFGCQFVPRPNRHSMPEFQVFSEHCAGGNFHSAAAYQLPVDIIRKWTGEVLRGMDFLHRHGIVHRNINSAVIFFSQPLFKGTVKIGGFHNMRQLEGDKTQRHEVSARQGQDGRFVSPEISNPAYTVNVGRKSDIWSLGCVVLHLATGEPPLYTGQNGRAIDTEMAVIYYLNNQKAGPEIPSWVPDTIRAFIGSCMQFNPANRSTAAGLLQEDAKAPGLVAAGLAQYHNQRTGDPLPQDTIAYWTQNNGCSLDI